MRNPVSFGNYQDRRKGELLRLLEVANVNLAETRDLIRQIFEPDSATEISNRVYRLQEQIRERYVEGSGRRFAS